MKFIRIDIPIFNNSVVFVGDCDAAEASDAIYRYKGKRSKVEFGGGCIGGVRDYGGDVFCWVSDTQKASIVFHELVHVASSIMETRNIPLCRETEELLAYLVQYLKLKLADKVWEGK